MCNTAPDWARINAERVAVGLAPADRMTCAELDASIDAKLAEIREILSESRRRYPEVADA